MRYADLPSPTLLVRLASPQGDRYALGHPFDVRAINCTELRRRKAPAKPIKRSARSRRSRGLSPRVASMARLSTRRRGLHKTNRSVATGDPIGNIRQWLHRNEKGYTGSSTNITRYPA